MTDIYSDLRRQITAGDVLGPNDAGYEESLRRWSAGAEKPAVRAHAWSLESGLVWSMLMAVLST